MIASTQIANTKIFAFIAVLICQSLSRKVMWINRKHNRNWLLSIKYPISRVNYCKMINCWNAKFSGYFLST